MHCPDALRAKLKSQNLDLNLLPLPLIMPTDRGYYAGLVQILVMNMQYNISTHTFIPDHPESKPVSHAFVFTPSRGNIRGPRC